MPVVLTPALTSELGLPTVTQSTVICAAVAVPCGTSAQDPGTLSPTSSAGSSHGSSAGVVIVALRSVRWAAVAARLLSRVGGASWLATHSRSADGGHAFGSSGRASVMLASDPVAGSAVASLVGIRDDGRDSTSTASVSREHSFASSASQGPSREAVAAAAASLSRSLSHAAASTRGRSSSAAQAVVPPPSEPVSQYSSASSAQSSQSGSRYLPPRQGSAAFDASSSTGYFETAVPQPRHRSHFGSSNLAVQHSTPILPSEKQPLQSSWRGDTHVPPPAPPRPTVETRVADSSSQSNTPVTSQPASAQAAQLSLQHQQSGTTFTTAAAPPSHMVQPPPPAGHEQLKRQSQHKHGRAERLLARTQFEVG